MKTRLEDDAERGFSLFSWAMPVVCEHLAVSYKETDRVGEQISFDIDNIPFTLNWDIKGRMGIGKMEKIINYQLSVWHSTWGTRSDPPESIDTLVWEGQSVWDAMKKATMVAYKSRVAGAVESVQYLMVVEQVEEM